MILIQARIQAKLLSIQYAVWYVRETKPGEFQPWAHSSDDAQTVATFLSGKEFKEGAFSD